MRLDLVALGLLASVHGAAAQEVTLTVRPGKAHSVTGKSDAQHLRRLASGVGWEFEPNAEIRARLKRLGIRTIRCINVDPLPGHFSDDGRSFTVGNPSGLLAHLESCRAIGANPHVIIATGLHPDLRVTAADAKDLPESVMGLLPSGVYGPKDWNRFRVYCRAYFRYVLLEHNFRDARFEVANEPDIGGAVCPLPPKPPNGSKALYEAYLNLYRNVSQAAVEFERENPGVRVVLGGPALAWAYTFRYGDFNWAERFLVDCAREKLKLDFIGLHYYGNISSIDGAYPAHYPPFREMLRQTLAARDREVPRVPLYLTEWGPSYHTDNTPPAAVNANHIGAAWSAAFLNAMLEGGVDSALYLVTTDLRRQVDGVWQSVWGWPSLFLNPIATGAVVPKAPCHVLDMVSRLQGERVALSGETRQVRAFATADPAGQRMTVLLWNYAARIPESAAAVEEGTQALVRLRVEDARRVFRTDRVTARRWQVDEATSNVFPLLQKGEKWDGRAELQCVETATLPIERGAVTSSFAMPPSSVCLVALEPAPRE